MRRPFLDRTIQLRATLKNVTVFPSVQPSWIQQAPDGGYRDDRLSERPGGHIRITLPLQVDGSQKHLGQIGFHEQEVVMPTVANRRPQTRPNGTTRAAVPYPLQPHGQRSPVR